MTTTMSPPQRDLLECVTVADFLIRNGPQGAAAVATERLAAALLVYYQGLSAPGSPDADRLRRDALRLWAEVRLVGGRLRLGPMRRIPPLRRKVEALLLAETMAADPARPATG